LWTGSLLDVLAHVPWQASSTWQRTLTRQKNPPSTVDLPVTVDHPDGEDVRADLPVSFDPRDRSYTTRRVRQEWVHVPTGHPGDGAADDHDPFTLLGW
jgi:CRISPR system Cascade subunit CasD